MVERYKQYKTPESKEHRRQYMKKYHKIWYARQDKEKLRIYMREYMRRHRGKYVYPKSKITQEKTMISLDPRHVLGNKFELEALKVLDGSTLSTTRNYDLLWNDKTIEVKARNYRKSKNGWAFRKNKTEADYYLFFCLEDKEIKRVLLIPGTSFDKNIGVTHEASKWDKFAIKQQ